MSRKRKHKKRACKNTAVQEHYYIIIITSSEKPDNKVSKVQIINLISAIITLAGVIITLIMKLAG